MKHFATTITCCCGPLLLACAMILGGCAGQEAETAETARAELSIFGNGYADNSPVIATVGDLEITTDDLARRRREMPKSMQTRFAGREGDRLALRYMIDEALMVMEAEKREVYLVPEVSQHLISMRRDVLKQAMMSNELIKDVQPTEEEIRAHFIAHRDDYVMQGTMAVRHVACVDKAAADKAYRELLKNGGGGYFNTIVAEYSTNARSKALAGELGWFNRGGFIPAIDNYESFSNGVWDLDIGTHEPIEIDGEWHIVEVTNRKYERRQTLEEARAAIMRDLIPDLQAEARENFLETARAATPIEFFGDFLPGAGRTDREVFEWAFYAKDPRQKIDIYEILVMDYPESELVDDALFMMGNVYLDDLADERMAVKKFRELVRRFPDSEFAADSQYIMENPGKARTPDL